MKALDVHSLHCRKIAAALREIVCDEKPQGKADDAHFGATARVACPETGRVNRGQKSQ